MKPTSKLLVKPGCLAQKGQKVQNAYEIERQIQIEKNAAVLKSFGIKVPTRSILMDASQSDKGKRCQTDGDVDGQYVPPETEDGLSSSESDDSIEVAPACGIKRKTAIYLLQDNTTDSIPPSPSALTSSTEDATLSPAAVVPSTSQAKKGRGKTNGKWLRLFKKQNGDDMKISVPIHEELNALSGNAAGKVARLLGMHIRQHCPVRNTPHWQNVSVGTQSVIIQAVLDHCDIAEDYHNNPQAQKVINNKCYLLHKDWWGKMKQHYVKVMKNGDDVYSKPYGGVTPDDWKHMIDDIWKSDKHKIRSVAGKANRALISYNHTSGSKSFVSAMTSNDAPVDDDGELDFPEFFKKTHQNKKEQWIDPLCEQQHKQMLVVQAESIQNSGQNLTPADFSEQVLGVSKRKGYLRGFGVGPKSFQSSFKSGAVLKAHDEEVEKLRIELDKQNKEREREREEQQRKFEEQERKIEEQQRKTEEQQRQFEEQRQQMETLQSLVTKLLQDRQSAI